MARPFQKLRQRRLRLTCRGITRRRIERNSGDWERRELRKKNKTKKRKEQRKRKKEEGKNKEETPRPSQGRRRTQRRSPRVETGKTRSPRVDRGLLVLCLAKKEGRAKA